MSDDINSFANGLSENENTAPFTENCGYNPEPDNKNSDNYGNFPYDGSETYSSPANGRITEITDGDEKKEKKHKTRFPFGYFAIILVICIIVSSLSGAGGAFFMYKILPVSSAPEETKFTPQTNEAVTEEFISDIETTEEGLINTGAVTEETSDEPETIPVTTTAPETTAEPETASPALTKGDIYAFAVHSIVAITSTWDETFNSLFGTYSRTYQNTGTGFIISNRGHIITNYHVVEKGTVLTVTDYAGNEYKATLIGSEPANDFAVLKIDAVTIPATLGNSSDLKVGDDIMVIGNALGELSYSFTDGIVSHLSRSVTVESGDTINMFQTNAAINNGNSGGPVYNMNGEVVGIASAKYASEKIEGLGFCIPIDDVKEMLADILLQSFSAE